MSNVKRRASYRNRHKNKLGRGGMAVLIIALLAVALFISAVILGNYLRSLVPEDSETDDSGATTDAPGSFDINAVPVVIAQNIVFDTASGETTASETVPGSAAGTTAPETTQPAGTTGGDTDTTAGDTAETTAPAAVEIAYNAYSVLLRDADGRLSYSSDITERYSLSAHGSVRLEDAVALYDERHISGVFHVLYPSEPSASRGFVREYELSLLRELFEAGIDDVVLCGFGDSDEELADAVAFVRELTGGATGSAKAGIALDFDFWSQPDAQERIRELHFDCGFLAFDLYSVEIPALMSPDALITDRLGRCGTVVNMYSARVLLGCNDNPDPDTLVRAAMTCGALNVQLVEG